ncbi:uncharacterized protein VP01_3617g1 [Puccinia sorghi]|uniref:Uncharacterized protein n=1 Tax=Puccinia sorghi TaxID=27349 RepID=A0A0L6UUX5_9BASI|nr:uncharacterized protein VP01_3617g1 [Puccinia sorghi]
MDALNARLEKLMHIMSKERAQRLATKETLRQNQACLNATAGQQKPAPASKPMCLPNHKPSMRPMAPLPRCLLDWPPCCHLPRAIPHRRQKSGVCRLVYEGLHSNLVPAVPGQSLQRASVITTASGAEVALRYLCQIGTVLAYTQDFNQHTRTVGWADTLLMSLYQNGLKENIQLVMVMSNVEFDSLQSMQAMAQKAQTIEGIQRDC